MASKGASKTGKVFVEAVGVTALFSVFTYFMYSPISQHMGGLIVDRWDGLLHTWELAWNVHKFTTGIGGIWDANIFWPHPDALVYTEHLLTQSVVAMPFLIATGNPILAHNTVTFVSFVLCGLAAFLLVRRLTGNFGAGLLAGMLYAFSPWRFSQLPHETPLLFNQWLPLALLFTHRTLDEKRLSDGLLFGLFFGLHSLASFYHAAMGAVVVATVFIVELVRAKWRLPKKLWLSLAAGGILAAVMVAPTMPPYYRVAEFQNFERTIRESIYLSADPLDYLSPPPYNRLWRFASGIFGNRFSTFPSENRLFPGLIAIALAVAGFRRRREIDGNGTVKTYFWVALVSFVFSLGPWLHVFWIKLPIPLPYSLAYHILPGFKGLRVPARFGVNVGLGLAVMAAYGYLCISRRRFLDSTFRRSIFTVALAFMILAEFYSAPLPHHRIKTGDEVPEVYRWLAEQKGDFPIIELPQMPSLTMLPEDMWSKGDPMGQKYMYYSTYHWKKLVNGMSGFVPPTSEHIMEQMLDFPSGRSIAILRYLNVKYVLLHPGNYTWDENMDTGALVADTDDMLDRAVKIGSAIVYSVPDGGRDWKSNPLDYIELKDVVFPANARPGSKFNVEVGIASTDAMPAYSFKAIEFSLEARGESMDGIVKRGDSFKDFLMVDPLGKQWFLFTIKAPRKKGRYRWRLTMSVGGENGISREFSFNQSVGDYPDSMHPGKLDAVFLEIDAPATVLAGSMFDIKAKVLNAGDVIWRANNFRGVDDYKGVVRFALKDWTDESGKFLEFWRIPFLGGRGDLGKSVPPGGTADVKMTVRAPDKPGAYKIVLDMVSEWVVWFGDAGSREVYHDIVVLPDK